MVDDDIINKNNDNVSGSVDEIKEEVVSNLKKEIKAEELYVYADIRINNSMDVNLGRLRKTLKDICPECGSHLELRVRECEALELGEEILEQEEYRRCPKCGTEYEYEERRQRRKRDKGNRNIDIEDGGKNGRYQKFGSTDRNSRKDNYGGNRRSKRTGFEKGKR